MIERTDLKAASDSAGSVPLTTICLAGSLKPRRTPPFDGSSVNRMVPLSRSIRGTIQPSSGSRSISSSRAKGNKVASNPLADVSSLSLGVGAAPAALAARRLRAAAAGFAIWLGAISLLATASDPLAPGPFLAESIWEATSR